MNIFDILGPIMVGPSSSHTAGAVRIGYVAHKLLNDSVQSAQIFLHGSFATTGIGHGTDKALIAGLLGMNPDDMRIPDSFKQAKEAGLDFSFAQKTIKGAHPNTALLLLSGSNGSALKIQASSLGGGRIMVNRLDDIDVNFSAEKPTLIVQHQDQPGHVAEITSMLAHKSINIATLQLYRTKRGGNAVMVLELDQEVPEPALKWTSHLEGIDKAIFIHPLE